MISPSPSSRSLSIVVPMYQELENVEPLLEAVHEGLADHSGPWELICVSDGSRDGTGRRLVEVASQYGSHVRVIRLRRNFGQTAAMQVGIEAARGELVATLDGDLQNDPADIPRMIEELQARDLDLLQGWRKQRYDRPARKLFSKIANRLIGRVTGVHLHDYGCSLKVYRTEVLREVRLFGEMHRFIPVWVAGVTSADRIGECIVNHKAREFGKSKYGLSRTFRVILDLLTVSFFLRYHARPGHFFGSIGLVLGAIGGLMLSWLAVVKFILGEDIGGRPMLLVGIMLLLASLQFITTGILAELLTRTFFGASEHKPHSVDWRHEPKGADWKNPGPVN